MERLTKLWNGIGNGFALVMMLPVVIVGSICLFTYWCVKFPFFLLSRRMRIKWVKK